jgi:putative flippase GtrA
VGIGGLNAVVDTVMVVLLPTATEGGLAAHVAAAAAIEQVKVTVPLNPSLAATAAM